VHQPAGPAVDVELRHLGAQRAHASALLLGRHVEGAGQRHGGLLDVVGVHEQGLLEVARGAGEAAEHEHAAQVVARGHEFLGHEVHAVVQAAHVADVGGAVVAHDDVRLVVLAQQDERLPVRSAIRGVDARGRLLEAPVEVLVGGDGRAAGRGQLHEDEAPAKLRPQLQQLLHRQHALLEALGVVHAVHADAQQHVLAQAQLGQHARAALLARRRGLRQARRPLDGDRVGAHQRAAPAEPHGALLAVDARLEEAVHRVEEVVAVLLGVEAHDAAAEHAREQLHVPRADGEALGVRPGDVPEAEHRRARQALADLPRRQRVVVVLHEDDRVLALGLLARGLGEALVHVAVAAPVRAAEDGRGVHDVAQRPEALVGEAVVVALLLVLAQPHAPQHVALLAGRHAQAVVAVDDLAIRGPAAVRHPRARAGAHHRLERGDEAAGGVLHHDATLPVAHVDVGLAVGQQHQALAVELAAQRAAQALGVPAAVGAGAVLQRGVDELVHGARQFRVARVLGAAR
jgi:hypothetical protein